jgi:nucleoside-diphosphate-sugar epimerase
LKVLLTGGAGFVGRHLHSAFAQRGDEVLNLDLAYGRDCMQLFLVDGGKIDPFDVVIHCAAFVKGRSGIDGHAGHLHTYNTMLDAAFLNWCMQNNPGHIVYFSSSAAYPVGEQRFANDLLAPLTEDLIDIAEPLEPEASYGMVKLHGEQMVYSLEREGFPATTFRPFSGYGADQALDYPFPSFIARAKRREDPFEIWGDGRQVRDWIHIDDIVAATLAAVDARIYGQYNLCTGVGTSFLELADLVTEAAGYDPDYVHHLDKPGGVEYRVGDPSRLNEWFTPTVTLEEGIKRALSD